MYIQLPPTSSPGTKCYDTVLNIPWPVSKIKTAIGKGGHWRYPKTPPTVMNNYFSIFVVLVFHTKID